LKYEIDSHFLFVVLTDVYCQVNLLQVTVFQAYGVSKVTWYCVIHNQKSYTLCVNW